MAYFVHKEQEASRHAQVFNGPIIDDMDDEDEDERLPDEALQELEDEEEELRRDRWRMFSAIRDIAAVVLGAAVILVLMMVIFNLCKWVYTDVLESFTLLQAWL